MPELPDITVYVECLARLVVGDVLREVVLLGRDWPRDMDALEEGKA